MGLSQEASLRKLPGRPMRNRRLHLVACWLAACASLVNVTGASAGLVHCESPRGDIVLEMGCAHDHCLSAAIPSPPHDHFDDVSCICETCSCDDVPVEVDAATAGKQSFLIADVAVEPLQVLPPLQIGAAGSLRERTPDLFERPPPFEQALRALRAVMLLI